MDLITEFARDQRERGLATSTIRRRRDYVAGFQRWLGSKHILNATEEDVKNFLRGKGEISPRTRYGWLSNLHAFYDWAFREGYTDLDPTTGVRRPKLPQHLPRPIEDADLTMGVEMATIIMRAWLTIMAFAGLRCGEVAGLDRAGFMDSSRMIRVLGKGNKERVVPMHDRVLHTVRAVGLPRTGPVFRRPMGGPYSAGDVSRQVSSYFRDLGIDATAHQLRHWFATKMYQQTRDIRLVQELLGHSNPAITAIYTKLDSTRALPAVQGLSLDRPPIHLEPSLEATTIQTPPM